MKSTTLRLQRVLVSSGFLLVGVGGLPLLTYWSTSSHDQDFYWIVAAVGYALFAWASWAWLATLAKRRDACPTCVEYSGCSPWHVLVLGIAYLGLINEVIELHRHHTFGNRAEGISDLVSLLGFSLAALGFWTGGSVVDSWSSLSQSATAETAEVEPTVR
jgi:hypothetical protein